MGRTRLHGWRFMGRRAQIPSNSNLSRHEGVKRPSEADNSITARSFGLSEFRLLAPVRD